MLIDSHLCLQYPSPKIHICNEQVTRCRYHVHCTTDRQSQSKQRLCHHHVTQHCPLQCHSSPAFSTTFVSLQKEEIERIKLCMKAREIRTWILAPCTFFSLNEVVAAFVSFFSLVGLMYKGRTKNTGVHSLSWENRKHRCSFFS